MTTLTSLHRVARVLFVKVVQLGHLGGHADDVGEHLHALKVVGGSAAQLVLGLDGHVPVLLVIGGRTIVEVLRLERLPVQQPVQLGHGLVR